ncbi:MAG: hypothetical protein LQ352_007278 [Teloschistes flavicans]|nr:MAG: hypothetical protein LQ352_007278 [Teloschistes flavicans]
MRNITTVRFSRIHPGVLLLLIILLVSWSIYPGSPTKVLKDGQSLEPRSPTGATLSTNGTRSLALPFGDQHYRPLAERQLGLQPTMNLYDLAVCNGSQMLNLLQHVNPNAMDFDVAAIYNGWTVQDVPYSDTGILGDRWDAAFSLFLSGQKPGVARRVGRQVAQIQNKPFLNKFNQMVQETQPTSAFLNVFFANQPIIIAVNIRSPANAVKRAYPGISQDEIQRRVPSLNRWSDVAWTVWMNGIGSDHPEWLRFIGFDRVRDAITLPVIQYIIARRTGGVSKGKAFPGYTITSLDPEYRALLGTPLGKAVGWILVDRGQVLQLNARQGPFTITIWSQNLEYFMLFDLQPNPNKKRSSSPGGNGALPPPPT